MLSVVKLLVSYTLLGVLRETNALAPPNPYLSESAWPIAQHDNYAQASSPMPGPLSAVGVDHLFSPDVAGPLTMLYTSDGKAVWGSSFKSVFKIDRTQNKLRLIDSIEKPEEWRQGDTFRGIYNILSIEGVFYISCSNMIAAYTDSERGNSLSGIKSIGTYDFSARLKDPKERVLALNMSYDGKIIFLTNQGGVGVLDRFLDTLIDIKYATKHKVAVTNSMSIDEFGGIYVVTSRHMHRLSWDGTTLHVSQPDGEDQDAQLTSSCGQPKCNVWASRYPVEDELILGRPTKEGSGTTPSLLKTDNDQLYVMIADGKIRQNVLAIDAMNGEIVARALVSFDNKDEESYTEQSILVNGNKFLVTQNALTAPAVRINSFLDFINAERIVAGRGLPEFIEENVYLLPVVLGDSPRGYQQFELDISTSPPSIKTVWTRNDVGCPNAIPTMSAATNTMYCVGKRTRGSNQYPRQGFAGIWTVEALSWEDGTTIFRADTGQNLQYNSLYAATQIGPDREIIYGSIGGVVRIRGSAETTGPGVSLIGADILGLPNFSPADADAVLSVPLKAVNDLVDLIHA